MGSLAASRARTAPDHDAVQRALLAAPHRGKDAQILTSGRCVLGVATGGDATDAWVVSEPGLAVAVAGMLDDVEALAERLTGLGHPPADPSDPASVVVAAWRAWGEDAPAHLRGNHAVALTDGEGLWAFRDQIGYRALFYRDDETGTVVASEAKQVASGAQISLEPDMEVLEHIFFSDYDDDTPAAIRGVRRLPKASMMRADEHGTRWRKYWHPERLLETRRYEDDDLAERFDALMTQAVTRGFRGPDVVALSGGIDSPAIAAYGARPHLVRYDAPLGALTASYPDQPSVDETDYVRLVAGRLDMPLHLFTRHASTMEGLQEWTRLFDGLVPVFLAPDAEMTMRAAREHGYRVMHGGFAAELVMDMRHSLIAYLLVTGRIGAARDHARLQLDKGTRPSAVARQILSVLVPRVVYATAKRWAPPRRGSRVPAWVDIGRVNARAVRTSVAPRARWRQAQLGGFRGPGLSTEAIEVVGELCGVASRRSWADVDLWEFFLSLPADQKFPDATTKGLVRRLLRDRVPDEILDRRDKTVFNESIQARIDYAELERWLGGGRRLIGGIDYDLLRRRLDARDLGVFEHIWARDLASVHAFVGLWDG